MKSFNELGLSKKTLTACNSMGYENPTPIQEKAIPVILSGNDIVAAAKTGTGKTGAFCIPTMDQLGRAKNSAAPLMLVVTPTRELAQQIGDVAHKIARSTNHRITTVVGGLSYKPQIKSLRQGCDILIATPGRLIDLMDQKVVNLKDVEVLVLDEADRMLDMGFLPSMKKIVEKTPKTRQTLLFSATIDKTVQSKTKSLITNPTIVEIAHKGDVADTINQYAIHAPQSVKPELLLALLEEKGANRVIVFARTRSRTDSTCRALRKAGYKAEAIHSNRSQNQRRQALDKFAKGNVNIIVATDVLARGIDVSSVDYVVNYDLPMQAEDYVHRIGRTGRAGERGFAVSFITPENRSEIRGIQRLIKTTIPELKLEKFNLSEAEEQACQRKMKARSKRDPELRQAAREFESREHKKQARRNKDSQGDHRNRNGKRFDNRNEKPRRKKSDKPRFEDDLEKSCKKSKCESSNRDKTGKPNKQGKPGKKAYGKDGAKNGKNFKKKSGAKNSKQGGKDNRPGRSQRAKKHTKSSKN